VPCFKERLMEITIRHAEQDDATALKTIYAQAHVIAGTMQPPFPSTEKWSAFLKQAPETRKNLVAVVTDTLVGHLILELYSKPRRKHVAGIGVAVDASVLHKGVGNALIECAIDTCDNWLNINRIELQVYVDNAPAIALYKKHGFEIEGTHRNFAYKAGSYIDIYSMARLRDKT
jgi:L-phenylalanine/L-methionine N-acetyltransferase